MRPLDSLEIEQDRSYERRKRLRLILPLVGVGVVIALGMLELTGGGPLANARARGAAGRLTLDYKRWMWITREYSFVFHVAPEIGRDTLVLWLDDESANFLRMRRVTPEPLARSSVGDRVYYRFADPRDIQFDVFPMQNRSLRLRAGLADPPDSLVASMEIYRERISF